MTRAESIEICSEEERRQQVWTSPPFRGWSVAAGEVGAGSELQQRGESAQRCSLCTVRVRVSCNELGFSCGGGPWPWACRLLFLLHPHPQQNLHRDLRRRNLHHLFWRSRSPHRRRPGGGHMGWGQNGEKSGRVLFDVPPWLLDSGLPSLGLPRQAATLVGPGRTWGPVPCPPLLRPLLHLPVLH